MYARGMPKPQVFATLSAGMEKPVQVARLVVSLPNPEGMRRYRTKNLVLSLLVLLLAVFAGYAKFAVGVGVNLAAGMIAAAVFFGIFAWCAWGIWQFSFPAYTSTVILLFLALSQTPRALMSLAAASPTPDGANGLLIALDVMIGLLLPVFLLWFTVRVRNNIFSRTGFFGGPRKDAAGNYLFGSAWERDAQTD